MDKTKKKPRPISELLQDLERRGLYDPKKKNMPMSDNTVVYHEPEPEPEQPKRFVLTCWDGDIYILTGYETAEQIHQAIAGLDWVRMPNGSQIKASSIAKVQSWEDYQFQQDQKNRHKRGQFLGGKSADGWFSMNDGYIGDADMKAIMPPGKSASGILPTGEAQKKLTEGSGR